MEQLISLIGRGLGKIYEFTGNLAYTVIITAFIVFVIKKILSIFIIKPDKKKLKDTFISIMKTINNPDIDVIKNIAKKEIDGIITFKNILSWAFKIISFFISIYVFVVIINATQYIPEINKETAYPFLFIDNILDRSSNVLFPSLCIFFMFFSQNIFTLKTALIDNFSKNAFRAAIMILVFTLYTILFGQIYLIYIMASTIFNTIFNIVKHILTSLSSSRSNYQCSDKKALDQNNNQ